MSLDNRDTQPSSAEPKNINPVWAFDSAAKGDPDKEALRKVTQAYPIAAAGIRMARSAQTRFRCLDRHPAEPGRDAYGPLSAANGKILLRDVHSGIAVARSQR